jgi:hypothetical protein
MALLDKKLCESGFCHNDLHTSNILYDINGNFLQIIDYGGSYINGSKYEKAGKLFKGGDDLKEKIITMHGRTWQDCRCIF